MLINFTPCSEEEAQKLRNPLLEKGIYDFEIISSEYKLTKDGKSYNLVLKLKVYDQAGKPYFIWDYIPINSPTMKWKLRHLCKAIGLIEAYEQSSLYSESLLNKSGRVSVKIRPGNEEFPPKNAIEDYIAGENSDQFSHSTHMNTNNYSPLQKQNSYDAAKNGNDFVDDDIPF